MINKGPNLRWAHSRSPCRNAKNTRVTSNIQPSCQINNNLQRSASVCVNREDSGEANICIGYQRGCQIGYQGNGGSQRSGSNKVSADRKDSVGWKDSVSPCVCIKTYWKDSRSLKASHRLANSLGLCWKGNSSGGSHREGGASLANSRSDCGKGGACHRVKRSGSWKSYWSGCLQRSPSGEDSIHNSWKGNAFSCLKNKRSGMLSWKNSHIIR